MTKLSDSVERKFTESNDIPDFMTIEVLSDTGYVPVTKSNETVPYSICRVFFENGSLIECADTHIFIDVDGEEVFAKDVRNRRIKADGHSDGVRALSVVQTAKTVNMYDLTVDSEDHTYYTDGILSHNTVTVGLDALHDIIFSEDYKVGITSYKLANCKDFLERIKYTYENLPFWMKPPAKKYNQSEVLFTNNSSVVVQVTKENTFRGLTLNRILLDEFAFVKQSVADEFWTSLLPSISAAGEDSTTKLSIISTPNGTAGTFANQWFGAVNGTNGFKHLFVDWRRIEGRTEAFKESMMKKMGRNKYLQEFECVSGDTDIQLLTVDGEEKTMEIQELFDALI